MINELTVSTGGGSVPPGSYLAKYEKTEPVTSKEYGEKL